MVNSLGLIVLPAALAVAALTLPSGAAAATMTFDGIDNTQEFVHSWSEDGILAVGDGQIGSFDVEGTAHMDDGGTDYAGRITFTMDRRFDARSVEVIPTGSSYERCDENWECEPLFFDNVKVNGFRDGVLVAKAAFDMYDVEGAAYTFGPEFRDLDALRIGFGDPFVGFWPDGSEAICFDSPCTHFSIDDVTLAPVPLPAALGLLGAALGGLAWVGRGRRG